MDESPAEKNVRLFNERPPPTRDFMNATVQIFPGASEAGYCYVKPDNRGMSYAVPVHEFWKYGSEPEEGMRVRVQFNLVDKPYLIATLDPNRRVAGRS